MAGGCRDDESDAAAPESKCRRVAKLDRMAARLERLAAQRAALVQATKAFGSDFDEEEWDAAFLSPDPHDINRVVTVCGDYQAIVNNTVEAVKIGAGLAGVKPTPGMRGAPGIIDAIRADGGFSERQATTFAELYRTRNRLQNASPDIVADEVHRQVRLLLRHLPRLMKSYAEWLKRHGIALI